MTTRRQRLLDYGAHARGGLGTEVKR
jgi:hypothetical protein